MKQKIDRITTGAKSISLRTLAMVLCFVMLLSAIGVGTVITAIAKSSNARAAAAGALSRAVADVAVEEDEEDDIVIGKKGESDLADTGANADLAKTGDWTGRSDWTYIHFVGGDLSGSGLDTQYFTSSERTNEFSGTWYIKNKNSDYANYEYNYYFKVHGKVKDSDTNYYLSLNNAVFGTNITGSGEHNGTTFGVDTINIYDNNGNMTLKTMPTPTGWVALQVYFKGEYSSKTYFGLYQSAVPALVASNKDVTTDGGTGVNVMPTISGGTGGTTRSYTVRDQYGNTVSDCMSGDTFTPPYVTETTTYYVDATVTDSKISTLVDTATVTVTVSPKESDWVLAGNADLVGSSEWSNTAYRMIQTGASTFVKTFTVLDAKANTDLKFKVVAYDNWKSSIPWSVVSTDTNKTLTGNAATAGSLAGDGTNDDNFKFQVTTGANITITFTDDSNNANKKMNVNCISTTQYTTTVNDTDTSRTYSTAAASASPASTYEGNRVTIATSPKAGYKAVVSVVDGSSNAVSTSKSGSNFYFTMPASNVTATVTYAETSSIPVTVYANSGGSVNVIYGLAVFSITEGEHDTFKVNEDDSIQLTAVPDSEHSFSKWYKNLTSDYSTSASITETITGQTTYVASFGGGAGDTGFDSSSYTTVGTGFSIKYSTGNDGSTYTGSSGTALSGTVMRSGDNDYYIELTSEELTAWTAALSASKQVRWNLFSGSTSEITDKSGYDVQYYDTTTSALKNCESDSDSTLLIRSKPNDYNSTVFVELSKIDSSVGSLGIHINTNTKKVNYYFGTSSEEGSVEYIPSTNYYAKDSAIRDGNYNFWIYSPKTTVTAVEDQVSVDSDHEGNNKWVEGYALKGTEITVTSIIPHRGKYKYTDSTGHTGDGDTDFKYADEKYYVAGFSFNGVTPTELKESDGVAVTGVTFNTYDSSGNVAGTTTTSGTAYTCTYTIPVDMKEAMLEITPILFVKEEYASETVMVYINGYNSAVQNDGWGNTLFMYPFYKYNDSTRYGQAENFGRYPGQPVINYGGQLYTQIPLTDDASADGRDGNGGPVKGITINNGYYDDVHKNYCNHVSVHRQTYDYDDFAKIYNEKKTKNGSKYLYSIYFSFKYKAQDSSQQHRLSSTTSAIDDDSDASRYNDLLASGNILDDTSGTVAVSKLETAGVDSGGWEYLQDALGNNVDLFGDKITDSSADPLRVFSLGYEYNNAGRWATEWAVYHKDGDNYELIYDDAWGIDSTHQNKGYNSSIVPSALIFNDKASLAAATPLDDDLGISGYAGLYEKLKEYRGIPVMICYEYDVPDGRGTKAYRCDGRWTYTTVDDFVRSNVKIEYYDKNGDLHADTFGEGTHVGTTTGCSAYFTNSAYYGATQSKSEIIDNSESYTFKAENVGSYEFVGWYMYDTAGHESTITTSSKTADTPRSGNFTLAARFKYIASGNLVISNSLAKGSAGRGTTYLGVTVKNGDKETVIANVNSNTSSVTLDKSYINATSNYQIIVQLRTVPTGENTFNSYTCYTTDGHTGTDVRSQVTTTNNIYDTAQSSTHSQASGAIATYTITVKGDVFDSTSTNQQNVKAIEYISTLNPVVYTYSVKFNYTSRQYGDQAFTQTGELTSGQINDTKVVTGTSGVADKKLTKAFLAEIAPHESNFNEKITWNFDSVVDSQTCTYDNGTNTYNISLNISMANAKIDSTSTEFSKVRHGYFTVPYAQTNGVANADGSGKVAKVAEDTTFTIDLNYDELFKIGDNLVIAPTVIYETIDSEEHERYFKYWEMWTASSNRGDSRLVGRCYFPEFNYRALDNYNIIAVYSVEGERLDGSTDNTESPLLTLNAYANLYNENASTTIDFIGNSRNQWNGGDKGTNTNTSGDLIYNDFIFTFKPSGNELLKDIDGAECGMIIQRLKEVEKNASGANAKTLQEYAKDYSDVDLASARAAATAKVSNTTTAGYSQSKISFTGSDVNEKNRYHYAFSMYNSKNGTATNNCKYLYRAYSYMIINDTTYVSEAPAYFCMYDIAQQ